MGLENYTRPQKIFFAGLIILLASTFTVTGAMMAVLEPESRGQPPEAAKVNGDGIRYVEYQRARRALGLTDMLDRSIYRNQDGLETMYARVPTLSPREVDGYYWGNANTPQTISLLNVWPQWQDQHLWCHMVLVKRAREAGIEPPSNVRVGAVLTKLMNEGRQEFEKFQQRDLEKEFQKNFGEELPDLLPTFKECLMVRDYVESQLAQQRATLEEIARISEGNHEQFQAEVAKLSIDAFSDRARQEVLSEHFAWQAARLAGGAGFATQGFGYDALEEAFDKNRGKDLQAEATFSFDVIQAYPEKLLQDGKVPINAERLKLTYNAMREDTFKATEEQKKDIENRVKAARDVKVVDAATKDWTEQQWKDWETATRAELLVHRSFNEVERDLRASLERENAVPAAQAAITELMRRLAETKKIRERDLNAGLEVARKEQAVIDGVKAYLETLRQRFTNMEEQAWVKVTGLALRVPAQLGDSDLKRLVDDFARELTNLEREQVSGLISAASLVSQDLERMRNDKRAQRDEFEAKQPKKNDLDELMTEAEVAAKLRGFDLDIEAIEERIRIRDLKQPLVEAFAEAMRSLLVGYELAVREIGQTGDDKLRAAAFHDLLVEVPGRIGKFVRDQADVIVAQAEIDDWDGRSQLIGADIAARQSSMQKDAADTRGQALADMCRELGLTMNSHGGGAVQYTWEKVVADENLSYLDFVDGARAFLEEPGNTAGKVSNIMALPGKGYLMLRLRDKSPKYSQSRKDAHELTLKLAVMNRARQLAVDALKEVRRDIVKNGWDAGIKRASEKYGAHFTVIKTDWFTDTMDIPGVYSDGDSDLLGFSSSANASSPDLPLMTRLREVPVRDGVSELLADKRNEDPLRRAEHDKWGYSLARLTGRRPEARRMTEDAIKEQGYGFSPSEIWRNRHLAGSALVNELITPALLLKDTKVILYKAEEPKDNAANEAGK